MQTPNCQALEKFPGQPELAIMQTPNTQTLKISRPVWVGLMQTPNLQAHYQLTGQPELAISAKVMI